MAVLVAMRAVGGARLLGEPLARRDVSVGFLRTVSAGEAPLSHLWVRGARRDAFERRLASHGRIDSFELVGEREETAVYSVEWTLDSDGIVSQVRDCDGVVLDLRDDGEGWELVAQFPTPGAIRTFQSRANELDIPVTFDRVEESVARRDGAFGFGLSDKQHEALTLALESGYFETPKRVSLSELADTVGVSEQALSQRIRRGNRTVLARVLGEPTRCTDPVPAPVAEEGDEGATE